MSGHLFNNRADYSYTAEAGVVCIVDHDTGRSVTNDAHNVIQDLVDAGIDVNSMPVIYRDSQGIWDQLIVNGTRFDTFKSINEKDKAAAIVKAKAAFASGR